MSRADYEACQAKDEQSVKAAVETLTRRTLEANLARVDYRAVVLDEWRRGGLDELIDKRVDIAVAEVRGETSWSELLQSLAVTEKAQGLATAVAERVYRSDAMKSAIETLAVGVGKEVAKTMESATLDAAEPAAECLQIFLGPRYGSTVAGIVGREASHEFGASDGRATVSRGAVLTEGREAIAGTVVLLVRRQLARMATRVGQRLVGAVLSRLVSVVAGGVGVVLIAKDIWELRHGVLPIVAAEMKAKTTKEKVQEELTRALAEQIAEHSREIASVTAERVVEIWQEFRRAHAKVLDLAEHQDDVRRFLDTIKPGQLARLDEVVALVLAKEGEGGVTKRIANGTLHQAVGTLPDQAMEIARETRSIEAAFAWNALAGPLLPKVVEFGLHKRGSPQDFTNASLRRVLGLGDRLSISRLASVSRGARDVLFELEDGELSGLARTLTEGELETLSRYLSGLERGAGQRVLRAVAQTPAKMQLLASPRIRDAVLASRDQMAAVAMMLRVDSGFDVFALREDAQLAYEGRISPLLLWDKHPVALVTLGLVALLLLFIMKAMLFGHGRTLRRA